MGALGYYCTSALMFCSREFASDQQYDLKNIVAMIYSVSRGVVRPILGPVRQQVKNIPAAGRRVSTTRRSALKLCVAMAANPIIEAYVKGILFFTVFPNAVMASLLIDRCIITV
jgi:hypothetical protein